MEQKLEQIEATIREHTLPDWVDQVVVSEMVDSDGKPALDVVLAVRDDRVDVVNDGALLARVAHVVHQGVRQAGVDLWPYTRFMSVSDLAAA